MKTICKICNTPFGSWNSSKHIGVCLKCYTNESIERSTILKKDSEQAGATPKMISSPSDWLKFIGIILLVIGLFGIGLTLNIDTTVAMSESGQRVNNIGLIAEKQNKLLIFITATIVGSLFFLFGRKS